MSALIRLNSLCFKNIHHIGHSLDTTEKMFCVYLSSGLFRPSARGITPKRTLIREEIDKYMYTSLLRDLDKYPLVKFKPEEDWDWNG